MPSEKPDSYQCGPFEVARNPNVSQFVDKLNKIREAVDQCRIQPGVGYTVNRSSGGTTLSIQAGSAIKSVSPVNPFALAIRKKDKKYQFYVKTGLINNGIKIENIEKWVDVDVEPPFIVYLEGELTDLVMSKASIKSQNQGDVFKTIEIKDGKQNTAKIAIGIYSNANKTFEIIQNVKTNLNVKNVCFDGYPAVTFVGEVS